MCFFHPQPINFNSFLINIQDNPSKSITSIFANIIIYVILQIRVVFTIRFGFEVMGNIARAVVFDGTRKQMHQTTQILHFNGLITTASSQIYATVNSFLRHSQSNLKIINPETLLTLLNEADLFTCHFVQVFSCGC